MEDLIADVDSKCGFESGPARDRQWANKQVTSPNPDLIHTSATP